jgi:hypothetical protein
MKFSTLFLALTFSVTAALTPVKKAEACLFVISPLAMVVGLAVGVGTMMPIIFNYDNIKNSKYDNYFNEIWLSVFAISGLDQDMDKIEGALTAKFPTIPAYALSEAALLLREKANLVEFNDRGYKSITLTEEEFADIEASMEGADADEVKALKVMLTTPEII